MTPVWSPEQDLTVAACELRAAIRQIRDFHLATTSHMVDGALTWEEETDGYLAAMERWAVATENAIPAVVAASRLQERKWRDIDA